MTQDQPVSSVPVLLWPPAEASDPNLPRIDLLSYMLDPKKPLPADDAHYFQSVEITTDRIFLGRYSDLERETQDAVRRDLQTCFSEQGCARSISVKEWAKQTTERQTPRLRLRCTKVCGFGFQVNFDMDRRQYYLVRSRGKSGNFLHKCAAPVTEHAPVSPEEAAALHVVPPPMVSITPTPEASYAQPTPEAQASLSAYAGAPLDSIILPQPVAVHPQPGHNRSHSHNFAVPGSIPAEIHTSLPQHQHHSGMPHQQLQQQHGTDPPPPPADGLDDFNLMIPSPPPATHSQVIGGHENYFHEQQQHHHQQQGFSSVATPAPVPSGNHNHVYQFQHDARAQTAQEFHDNMDTSSVDSTDMAIARHFGMNNTGQQLQQQHQHQTSSSSALSDNSDMFTRSERMMSSGNAANRTQVNNEAEYPTVNSMRSFLSMMTGSINSTLGSKMWFGRSTSTSTGHAPDENLSNQYSMSRRDSKQQQHQQSFGAGGDPMDTVNSALSALSFAGMQSNTLGTTQEETGSKGSDGGANPFSADFWSPPEQQQQP
mmetsp:Transcript_9996/g.19213  ORF Transcript_9996/g.19213 Transcript_9996/m.19213 type:complete len:541 (+) Transcript_9996:231-1853(+)